jgi:hypothetical protein
VTAGSISSWLITTSSAGVVLGPFGLLYLVVFAVGFVVTAYIAGPMADRLTGDPARASLLSRRAKIGMNVFGAGLFFLGMRTLQIDALPFGWPIWLVASTIAAAVYLMQCLRWRRSSNITSLA